MHLPLTTDRQRFYQLLSLVCEDIATKEIDALVRNGHAASASQLLAVRWGRKVNLPWLIDLTEASLPQFKIPAELRPAQVPAPLFQDTE
jgi:hypothetical protein